MPSNPQPFQSSASKGKQCTTTPNPVAGPTGAPQVHDGFGFQPKQNPAPQVNATPQVASPASASQQSGPPALTLNDIVNIWESLPSVQKHALLLMYATGHATPQLLSSTVLPQSSHPFPQNGGVLSTSQPLPASVPISGQQCPARHPDQLLDNDHEMADETNTAITKNWPAMRPTVSSSFAGPPTSPEEPDRGSVPGPPGPVHAPPSSSHITVLLLNKMDAVDAHLDTHAQAHGEIAKNLWRMVPITAFPMPPMRSRGRASRSKTARILLATATPAALPEREDFSAQLRQIDEEEGEGRGGEERRGEEGASCASPHTQQPSSAHRNAVRPAFVSTDGWVMPPILRTSSEEELQMVATMTLKQATQVELTFVRCLQDAVRNHVLRLLCISSLDEVGAKCPTLTDVQFGKWMATKPDFTLSTFGINFKHSWAKCVYNRAGRDYLTRHFLESVSGGSYKQPLIPSRYFTLEQVGLALDSHMDHARIQWRQQVNPPNADVVEQRWLGKQNNTRKVGLNTDRSTDDPDPNLRIKALLEV
ncbi:hypothetical protein LXA43DRAFT_1062879 [Ganoderma leucocontextum]|nr:hypothetical protein LXA43DRAFT_1062879 [Ganoderma leucocontextum]